ncbi:MAG: hypothetical protein ACKV19_25695 [Verrucomicrobiales bacterium]
MSPHKSKKKAAGKAAVSKKAPAKKAPAKKAPAKKAPAKKAAGGGHAPPSDPVAAEILVPKANSVTVRMYRIGHGDCFLLAFPREESSDGPRPVYVLIDCGYKPESPDEIVPLLPNRVEDVTRNIVECTGGFVDVAVITHEHQDHVNAISMTNFAGLKIGETWFAWTENDEDDDANRLREQYEDKLLGLAAARRSLAAAGDKRTLAKIDELLAFELGLDAGGVPIAEVAQRMALEARKRKTQPKKPKNPLNSANKKAMLVFKELAEHNLRFFSPHEKIVPLPGNQRVRIYALGPPREELLLNWLDPVGDEGFHRLGLASTENFFAAAAATAPDGSASGDSSGSPFSERYHIPYRKRPKAGSFLDRHYGNDLDNPTRSGFSEEGQTKAPDNAEWRRIGKDWLYSAESLALAMNTRTNNSSLVLAFELGKGGKVLLFVGDAQRGNWISWAKQDWRDGDQKVSARDLLGRTVLYKVGHHGSHNATLDGTLESEHPNLSWMAQGEHAEEFTAMITAVRKWALEIKWDHPLPAIKDALLAKAAGRVLQTDTELAALKPMNGLSAAEWKKFTDRTDGSHPLYFDHTVNFT